MWVGSKAPFDLLHADAIPRTSSKWYPVLGHCRVDTSEPPLGNEIKRLGIYCRVGMHEICGHADRDLKGAHSVRKALLSARLVKHQAKSDLPLLELSIAYIELQHRANTVEVDALSHS